MVTGGGNRDAVAVTTAEEVGGVAWREGLVVMRLEVAERAAGVMVGF